MNRQLPISTSGFNFRVFYPEQEPFIEGLVFLKKLKTQASAV